MTDNEDRRDPDRQIFRDLYAAINGFEDRFNDLKPLLEKVAVIGAKVHDSEHEIDRLRTKVDKLSEDLSGLIAQIKESKAQVPSSGISSSWVAVVLSLIGLILTALFKLVEWIKDRTP